MTLGLKEFENPSGVNLQKNDELTIATAYEQLSPFNSPYLFSQENAQSIQAQQLAIWNKYKGVLPGANNYIEAKQEAAIIQARYAKRSNAERESEASGGGIKEVLSPNVYLRVGTLADFTDLELIALNQVQPGVYFHRNGFGSEYKKPPTTTEELTQKTERDERFVAEMQIASSNDLLAACFYRTESGSLLPLGSLRATLGEQRSRVKTLNGNKKSSLSTLKSLKLADVQQQVLGRHFGDFKERELVCFSHFFTQSPETMDKFLLEGLKGHHLSSLLIAKLGQYIPELSKKLGRRKAPTLGIFDIDSASLMRQLANEDGYQAVELSAGQELEITQDAQESASGPHYAYHHQDLRYGAIGLGRMVEMGEKLGMLLQAQVKGKLTNKPLDRFLAQALDGVLRFDGIVKKEVIDVSLTSISRLAKDTGSSDLPTDPEQVSLRRLRKSDADSQEKILASMGFEIEQVSAKPFYENAKTARELLTHFEKVFAGVDFQAPNFEQLIQETVLIRLKTLVPEMSEEMERHIRIILNEMPMLKNLAWYIPELQRWGNAESIEAEAHYIGDPIRKRVDLEIGPELRWLLTISRNLNLIDFDSLKKLRKLKVRVIGASVAASIIDLLIAMGCEDVEFVDGGRLDVTNGPRSYGDASGYTEVGEFKATEVQISSQKRSPYANVKGHPGKARLPGFSKDKYEPNDVALEEFMEGADLVLEVVDDAKIKIWVRSLAKENQLIGFPADVGSDPFAGLEDPTKQNWFNQDLSVEQKDFLTNFSKKPETIVSDIARATLLMLAEQLPPEHLMQFILWFTGIVSFWSQTAISARESSAVFLKLLLQHLGGEKVTGRNIPASETPKSLVKPQLERISPETFDQVHQLVQLLFFKKVPAEDAA